MAPHSCTLAWKIPWMEETDGLQSMGSQRVRYDWETSLSLFTFMHWRRKWQPTPVFLLENPRDGGEWRAAIYGVAQSWTRLKRLSSSSSSSSSTLAILIGVWWYLNLQFPNDIWFGASIHDHLPFVYLFWWSVCSDLLPILWIRSFVFFLLDFKSSWYSLYNHPLSDAVLP